MQEGGEERREEKQGRDRRKEVWKEERKMGRGQGRSGSPVTWQGDHAGLRAGAVDKQRQKDKDAHTQTGRGDQGGQDRED